MFIRNCCLGLCAVFLLYSVALADDTPKGLISELSGKEFSDWAGLKEHGVNLGGWATSGINHNFDNPEDRSNGPVSMTDRADEFNLYQLNLFIEKTIVKEKNWDVGGRFDFMFGTDSKYTQATGHWDTGLISQNNLRLYDIALPQAYVEVYAPYGNGVTAKFGHFYGLIGYESVPSPPNFFSSHTYSFKSSPFTATGALFSYALNEEWTVNVGAVTGADNFARDLGAMSHMSGLTWNHPKTGTLLSFSVLQGDVYKSHNSELVYYTAYLQQSLGKWTYVLQNDRGTQQNAITVGKTAEWHSIVHYLTYQATEEWGVGMRGEWFKDTHGARYSAGAADYYALTGGVNWKPNHWLIVRPEVRYDWSHAQTLPYDGGHQAKQVLVGVDAVIQF